MSAETFTLPSFAKINLALRVLGRRADGYHEIRTVFQTVTLHDELTLTARDDELLELSCDAPDVPVDETNLVQRAANALRERYGVPRGAHIELDKRIPSGGGLGGGSSNAAAALLGLTRLWRIDASKEQLSDIGARIGADVPFFFAGGTALGTGRGTEIHPLPDAASCDLLIVTPSVAVSTAEAYRSLDALALTKPFEAVNLHVSREGFEFSDSLHEALANDFEAVIYHRYPEIERVRKALLDAGARAALLSGSGSSVFGIFDSQELCEHARTRLERAETSWRVVSAATLSRARYREALGACAAIL